MGAQQVALAVNANPVAPAVLTVSPCVTRPSSIPVSPQDSYAPFVTGAYSQLAPTAAEYAATAAVPTTVQYAATTAVPMTVPYAATTAVPTTGSIRSTAMPTAVQYVPTAQTATIASTGLPSATSGADRNLSGITDFEGPAIGFSAIGGRGMRARPANYAGTARVLGTGTAPSATIGFDTNLDGTANFLVSGADRNLNGIPDFLEGPGARAPIVIGTRAAAGAPTATIGLDTNLNGSPNLLVTGADRNFNGIPDFLEGGMPGATMLSTMAAPGPSTVAGKPSAAPRARDVYAAMKGGDRSGATSAARAPQMYVRR